MTIARILVPTDFSGHADTALEYARGLAQTFGASVHLLHVMDDPLVEDLWPSQTYTAEMADVYARLVREAEERLQRTVPPHSTGVTCEVRPGYPPSLIVDVARERGIDLIVMGTHGRTGLAHLVMGSVAERVVRLAPCPVLTLRKDATRLDRRCLEEEAMNLAFRTIVVATDFGEASNLALEYARVLADRFGADLRLLHVVDTPRPIGTEIYLPVMTLTEQAIADAQRLMDDTLATFKGTPVVGQVLVGSPAQKIVEYATDHNVDLIVMGTHGRGGLAHMLMGSVAERVVRTAPCPVFTVRDTAALERVEEEEVAVAVG